MCPQTEIVSIIQATRQVADICQGVMLATTHENEEVLIGQLQNLIWDTNKGAVRAKALLQKMRDETQTPRTSTEEGKGELRIRNNVHATLQRKFVDALRDYQNAQSKYKTDIKKKIKRQLHILKPDATDGKVVCRLIGVECTHTSMSFSPTCECAL
jgi:syntaxin 1B/2/3